MFGSDSFDMMPWEAIESEYSKRFPSKRGRPAKSARIALGALIIKLGHESERVAGLVDEIARNPYYQYFIGLESYQTKCPFVASALTFFRKGLSEEMINTMNEAFLKLAKPTPEHAKDKSEEKSANGNAVTFILDASVSPSLIRHPQDFSLLNEAREKLDTMIDHLHNPKSGIRRPRTYRKVLRKTYLTLCQDEKTDRQENARGSGALCSRR